MNLQKISGFVAYGALMGLLFFSLMRPKNERIFLAPDQSGSYSGTISDQNFTATIYEMDHRVIHISFKPKRDLWDYLLPIAMGVAIGVSAFRARPQIGQSQLGDADPRIVTEHKLYSEFLCEDSNRSLLAGTELISAFSSWLEDHHPIAGTAEHLSPEQIGSSNEG